MNIGIFAKTFERSTLEDNLRAVKEHGIRAVQYNMSCAGLPPMSERIDHETVKRIRTAADSEGITIAAVSGTCNMAHPDAGVRQVGIDRLRGLASICSLLGTSIITLCTGTRDVNNMWRKHPDNHLPEAWRDLVVSMEQALDIADEYDVTLAFEPEPSNVVDSAGKGCQLIREMQSPRLKVVFDAANLLSNVSLSDGVTRQQEDVLNEAFDLLGEQIALAHAKDVTAGSTKEFVSAGQGTLSYALYVKLLRQVDFRGYLILHGLKECEVDDSVAFLREKLSAKA